MKFQDKFLREKTHLRSINMVWSVSSPRITAMSWPRTLRNSMKPWAMPYRTTQDGWVVVKSSDKTWSTGGGMANHSSILAVRTHEQWCKEPHEHDVKSRLTGKDPDVGKDWRQEEKGAKRMRWLDSITNSMHTNLRKVQEIEKDRESWHATLHGSKRAGRDLATEQQNWSICS